MAPTKEVLDELLVEARKRQRKKTDLLDFEPQLKEMMRLNISLPIILGWLEKEDKKTTLPALRRYVKKAFGEDHYEEFTKRNGWMKVKVEKEEQKAKKQTDTADVTDVTDVLDRSGRSGDHSHQEAKEVAPEQQNTQTNDNPLISMGVGTSLKDEGNVPKTTLTFNKRNQVDKS